MRGSSLAFLALFFLLVPPAFAADIPEPTGFVNDTADVIDAGTEQKLTALISELQEKTSAEIAILTIPTVGDLSAFDYGMQVVEKWKPGDPEKDNGVLFLLVTEDRQTRIFTGYGVEGALPDGKVGAILDQYVLPHFKEGNFSQGIVNGTVVMASIVAEEYGAELTGAPRMPEPRRVGARGGAGGLASNLVGLILFVLAGYLFWQNPLLFLMFMGMGGARRGGFGGGFGGGGFGGGGFGGFGGGGFGGGGAGRGF